MSKFRLIGGGGVLGDLAFDGGAVPMPVPEPSSAFLLMIGLMGIAASSRSWWPFKAASSALAG